MNPWFEEVQDQRAQTVMNKIYFSLILHAHQPVGNFEEVFERAYDDAYQPFLMALEKHPRIRLSLHFSGGLLQWIEKNRPEYFDSLRVLVQNQQVELIGGGFYEPILTAIPESDALEQIERLSEFLKAKFNVSPRGLWLAERVWEPRLPTLLHRAGIEYLSVDDSHFMSAGLRPEELRGYYVTEDQGNALRIIPGSQRLRYLIPFRGPGETIDLLQKAASAAPDNLVAMADDLEKFGVWPKTHEHVYTQGWLERFFQALEENAEWIEPVPADEYLDRFPPLGRVYLPTAAYSEMMTWALPVEAQKIFEQMRHQLKLPPGQEVAEMFLRGGFFRNFLARYPEANLLHKRMLHTSRRYADLRNRARFAGPHTRQLLESGYDHLLRAQANDAFWHGVFGGLYAPHLRLSVQRNLSLAESFADELEVLLSGRVDPCVEVVDFDSDLDREVFLSTPLYSALLDPQDGATLAFLDFKPAAMDVINSLTRRPEVYHEKVYSMPESADSQAAVTTIHEMTASKETNLQQWLIYDKYQRHAFRALSFPGTKTLDDFFRAELDADPNLSCGRFELKSPVFAHASQEGLEFIGPNSSGILSVHKRFKFSSSSADELAINAEVEIEWSEDAEERQFGWEFVFNLLAPDEPDRYLEVETVRHRLRWQGALEGLSSIALVDEHQKVRIDLETESPTEWWITPIFAVSQSEEGFEAVYQGSIIFPHWRVTPKRSETFKSRVTAKIRRIE